MRIIQQQLPPKTPDPQLLPHPQFDSQQQLQPQFPNITIVNSFLSGIFYLIPAPRIWLHADNPTANLFWRNSMDNHYGRPTDPHRSTRRPAPGQSQRPPANQRPYYSPPASAQRPIPYQQNQQAAPPRTQQQSSPGRTPPSSKSKKKSRSENRWGRAILMVLATVMFCGFLALFILQSALDMFGLNQEDQMIEVNIPEEPSLSQISSILSKSGIIDQGITFQLYASIKQDEQYYGGDYVFNVNMGYDEILSKLRTKTVENATVTITFVEGVNVYEIAQQLEDEGVCNADEFLEIMETADFGYEFMDQLPEDGIRFRRLEGYLFPDTYEFYVGENVESVARRFLSNFSSKITTQMSNRMRDLNLTLDETITLASIIQKEAGGVHGIDEMKRVSSVFHNRLNLAEAYPKLQSDVTREYVNRFIKPFLDFTDQELYDAYNTYACDGLPAGPICNPSADAIEAALYPADSNYYFFVTDVKEQFYYSETADEHYQKVITASNVEGEGEIHGTDTE